MFFDFIWMWATDPLDYYDGNTTVMVMSRSRTSGNDVLFLCSLNYCKQIQALYKLFVLLSWELLFVISFLRAPQDRLTSACFPCTSAARHAHTFTLVSAKSCSANSHWSLPPASHHLLSTSPSFPRTKQNTFITSPHVAISCTWVHLATSQQPVHLPCSAWLNDEQIYSLLLGRGNAVVMPCVKKPTERRSC